MARTGEFLGKDAALHDVIPPVVRETPPSPGRLSALPNGAGAGGVSPLEQRLCAAMQARGGPTPQVIRAEDVTLLTADLPVRGTRQRRIALAFALEDRIGEPLDRVHCALGPAVPGGAHRVLAAVVGRAVMERRAPGPVLPETMAVPRPDADATWNVWSHGGRAVVRLADGTGFAVGADALGDLWARAGRPALVRLGDALGGFPADVAVRDLSAAPPPVAPADLAFDLAQGPFAGDGANWSRTWRTVAIAAGVAVIAHLGLLAVDRIALERLADRARVAAETAVAPVLPGIALGADPAPILARLAPGAPEIRRSDFLPLLGDVSQALLSAGADIDMRRLGWSARDGQLRLLLEAGGLEVLQDIERRLGAAELRVSGGAATVRDGAAQTELTVARGAGG